MNIEDILTERYRAFENVNKGWGFFIYLNGYIQYIYKTQDIKGIIDKIENDKKGEYKKYRRLKNTTFKEIMDSKKELLQIIKKNKFKEESLKALQELRSFEEGSIWMSGLQIENYNKILSSIANELSQKGYCELIDKFIVNCTGINNIYVDENLMFSKTYNEFFKEKERINFIKKDKIWYCWYCLRFIPEISNSDKIGFENVITDIKEEISEEDVDYVVNFGMINAKQKTSNYAFEPNTSEGFEEDIKIYKDYAKRLHLYILEELSILKTNTKEEKVVYNDGTLFFKGAEFDFNNKPIQKDLLNTLFKKPKCKWTNDEIWEDWGENDFKAKTLKFYTASDEINKTIALDTGIRDFLIKSTKQIQINPKYLEQKVR